MLYRLEILLYHRILLATLVAIGLVTPASAQLFFRDNFNRTANIVGSNPSTGPGSTYTGTIPANVTASTTGTVLQINNTTANNGNAFAASTMSAGFTSLSTLPRWTQWTFNMRISSAPTGFDAGEFGIATVLASTTNDFDSSNGYAVVFGRNGSNVFELVSFNGGLDADANMTSIIASAAFTATNFASLRVTYNPVGNNWQLFLRDDGNSAFTDPLTGVTTQAGTTQSNNTFTGVTANLTGYYDSYGTTDGIIGTWDNMTVAAVPEPTTWALIGLGATALVGGVYRLRRGNKKLLNTEVDLEEAEVA